MESLGPALALDVAPVPADLAIGDLVGAQLRFRLFLHWLYYLYLLLDVRLVLDVGLGVDDMFRERALRRRGDEVLG